jgi:outer membrane protein assembly factor BamD (BamD/ComL family)
MFNLGNAYYQQTVNAKGSDYSKARQMFERLVKEFPATGWWSTAKQQLMNIEIASLPLEQQAAARQQAQAKLTEETIDHYNKQLTTCKGDNCANIIYTLGTTYYSQQVVRGAKADYSKAIQMFERLLKEYPNHSLSQTAKSMLTNIENMQKKSQ